MRNDMVKERIMDFIEANDIYDFAAYMYWSKRPIKSLDKWLEYVKNNYSNEIYKKVIKKACPFSFMKNPDEVKEKVVGLANDRKTTLIDIVEQLGCTLNQYIYLVKLLREEKRITHHTYMDNIKSSELWYGYNKGERELTLDFPNVTLSDLEKVKRIVSNYGLELNDITYHQAFKYALKNDIIKLQKNILR